MSTARAQRLLEAPILPTLARLAAPGIVLVVFQSAVSITDTYFVGRLGTEPLAGLALVFPLLMLLQMMSAGAMGGGVSAAVARALGAGDERKARALVVHAFVIAIGMGIVFTLLLLAFGRSIYALLGGKEAVIEQALAYSNVLFCGAVLVWLANTLAAILRGSGNTLVPALALVIGAIIQIPLSGALVLGLGPFPRLGIGGAAVAFLVANGCAAATTAVFLWRGALRPERAHLQLQPRLFGDILRVGLISSVHAVLIVLTAVVLTGLVARFGTAALAGYGVGLRLELLQVPIVFAVGQALVAVVGVNMGAGRTERAKRVAWTGAAMAGCISGAVGFGGALFPLAWVRIFSSDPAVLEAGSLYLRMVGPVYAFMGMGVALYFASQGAGRMMMPMLSGAARLAIVLAGGFAVTATGAPLGMVFAVVAVAITVYGTLTAWAVFKTDWGNR